MGVEIRGTDFVSGVEPLVGPEFNFEQLHVKIMKTLRL